MSHVMRLSLDVWPGSSLVMLHATDRCHLSQSPCVAWFQLGDVARHSVLSAASASCLDIALSL